jgi:phospholipid/cholesterol/gamma-HCH transport system ATP-binding protein
MNAPQNVTLEKKSGEQEVVVRVRDLFLSFGKNKVLQGFNFDLHRGENLVVVGKSGSGKSVLIKCLVGLLQPDSGIVEVLGENVLKLNQEELDHLRVKMGFLFQGSALYDSMTVRENLEFPLRRHWIDKEKDEVEKLITEALSNVGLEEAHNLMPAELSGGMRKRVGLARTLILKPEIMLYDEPTTGLDPITSKGISRLILDIRQKLNTSSIIITHDLQCARIVADRVLVLADGICHASGTFEELLKSEDPVVKEFFEDLR